MALKGKENFRGIELEESYNKICRINLDMAKYKDTDAREDNILLEAYTVPLQVTSAIYAELKKLDLFKDMVDC